MNVIKLCYSLFLISNFQQFSQIIGYCLKVNTI